MRYQHTKTDHKNSNWFLNDFSRDLLHEILFYEGHLRGLSKVNLKFQYPITAIAGRNGSGKSTALAVAACAFHNNAEGFNPKSRNYAYYTFSDFFIQSSEEVPPDGIQIYYKIASDKWRNDYFSEGKGVAWMLREKKKGGRWTNYEQRIVRNVIFFGIDRVVPHYEKTVSKSHRKAFATKEAKGWENAVATIVGRILNRKYDKFTLKEHAQYKLPVVQVGKTVYSGFNMGAGENALFDIISTILSGPKGMLLVVDEIELGLHEEAQIRLIDELKEICFDRSCQIICTTHSSRVLSSLPPEARIFLESSPNGVTAKQGISPEYATGKLSGTKMPELEIFVEDEIAKEIVEYVLPLDLRSRVSVTFIGSDMAIVRHLAALYRERDTRNFSAVFDGDKADSLNNLLKNFLDTLESYHPSKKEELESWFKERVVFLPGKSTPEKWALHTLKSSDLNELSEIFGIDQNGLEYYVKESAQKAPHSEFFFLSQVLNLDQKFVRHNVFIKAIKTNKEVASTLVAQIKKRLDSVVR